MNISGDTTMPPLAERMRPKGFSDFVGQAHLVGENGIISKAILAGHCPSMIFWGPPGTGKTTLAKIISNTVKRPFFSLSAVSSGVKDVREIISKGEEQNLFSGKKPILFIDEIHRFSKSQQDALLNAVESGTLTLIGATTENPGFEVIPALISRCQVYTLQDLSKSDLESLLLRALKNDDYLKEKKVVLKENEALIRLSGGDARKLLNSLEWVINALPEGETEITNEKVEEIIHQRSLRYDKGGEYHYDTISAFIKSVRGSDPDAAVYWLARMIEGGEDPKFVARRLVILAAEDIGLANPTALALAQATFSAVETIGLPEARIPLSQCTIYLACSPKSNSAYLAIDKALELVRKTGSLPVPIHLRNAPIKLMKELGYGKEYQYPHAFPGNFIEQEYLPEALKGEKIYEKGNNVREVELEKWLEAIKNFGKEA